jgi:hypothetical protein
MGVRVIRRRKHWTSVRPRHGTRLLSASHHPANTLHQHRARADICLIAGLHTPYGPRSVQRRLACSLCVGPALTLFHSDSGSRPPEALHPVLRE